MKINERIKARRKELGLTLKQVAEKLNVSESLISRYESNDVKNMGIDKIAPLAKVLKTTPSYLMGWEDKEQKPETLKKDLQLTTYEKEKLLKDIENEARKDNKNVDYLIEKYNLKDFSINIKDSTLLRMAKDFKIHFLKEKHLDKTINSEIKNWFLETLNSLSDKELEQLKVMIEPTIKYLKNRNE